jgi:hypothetical protein
LMSRLRLDPYILLLLVTVGIASLLPARGIVAVEFTHATAIAIGLLSSSTAPDCQPMMRWPDCGTGGCTA